MCLLFVVIAPCSRNGTILLICERFHRWCCITVCLLTAIISEEKGMLLKGRQINYFMYFQVSLRTWNKVR